MVMNLIKQSAASILSNVKKQIKTVDSKQKHYYMMKPIKAGSYRPEETKGGLEAEIERLRVQVELSWNEEKHQLIQLGLENGMSVLELGSGPGFLTERLLSLLPSSPITAVEINPELLAIATERLTGGPAWRLQLVEGSIFELDLPQNTYDFVIARFVFQHLENPVQAAKEALRLLRPGGLLVVVDVDTALWGITEPYFPQLYPIYQKAERLQPSRGGNRLIGRQLWRILKTAGFETPRLEVYAYHSDELGIKAFDSQMSPNRLLPALHAGLISAQEFEMVEAAYCKFLESPNAYVLMLGLMAHSTKPMSDQHDGSVVDELDA